MALNEDNVKTKQVNGQTRYEVDGKENPSEQDLLNMRIRNQLGDPFTKNLTAMVQLQDAIENLPEDSVVHAEGKVLLTSYQNLQKLNELPEKIGKDVTRTLAEQYLLKKELSEREFQTFEKQLDRIDADALAKMQEVAKDLFSVNSRLDPIDQSLLPQYVQAFQGKSIDRLIEGTPSDALICLELAKNYPALIKLDTSYEALTIEANAKHTPEAFEYYTALADTREQVTVLMQKYREAKAKFVDTALIEEIKSVQVAPKKRPTLRKRGR